MSRAAGERGRFQLIDIMLARGALSATLSRFVVGIKRLQAAGKP